jgi:hypothetical protein
MTIQSMRMWRKFVPDNGRWSFVVVGRWPTQQTSTVGKAPTTKDERLTTISNQPWLSKFTM